MALKHAKTNNVASWTQADLDVAISKGQFAPGTTIADITLSGDWNADHVVDAGGIKFFDNTVQTTAYTGGGGSYTFTNGLTEAPAGTVSNDLITGKAGGQTVVGGIATGESITITSNGTATKGKINLGSTGVAIDEATNFLGLGNNAPVSQLHISGNISLPTWTNNGPNLLITSRILTDTTGSGTINTKVGVFIGAPTFASTSATTVTRMYNVLIAGGPVAGTNTTFGSTPVYALYCSAGRVGGPGGAIYGAVSGGGTDQVNTNPFMSIGGSLSIPSWQLAGALLGVGAAASGINTLTDTTGTGTIATRVCSSFAANTLASTNVITVTNAANTYIAAAPAGGTNTTITNSHGILIAAGAGTGTNTYGITANAQTGGTNNYAANLQGNTISNGGMSHAIRVVTAAGTITTTSSDYTVVVNKTVAAVTSVTLTNPPAGYNQTVIIKDGKGDANTNNITVTPTAGLIDGAANKVMNINSQAIKFHFDGTNWWIV